MLHACASPQFLEVSSPLSRSSWHIILGGFNLYNNNSRRVSVLRGEGACRLPTPADSRHAPFYPWAGPQVNRHHPRNIVIAHRRLEAVRSVEDGPTFFAGRNLYYLEVVVKAGELPHATKAPYSTATRFSSWMGPSGNPKPRYT